MSKKIKNKIIFIILFALLSVWLTASVLASVEDNLAADKNKNNLISNGDFADADNLDFNGGWTLKTGEGIGGSNVLEVSQGAAAVKNMTDLTPNTEYTFVAYVKILEMEGGDPPCLVIKGWGGDDIYSPAPAKEEGYFRLECTFMVTENVKNPVELHIWNVTAGLLLVDSMFLFVYEPPATDISTTAEPSAPTNAKSDETSAGTAVADGASAAPQSTDDSGSGNNMTFIIVISVVAVVIIAGIVVALVMRKKSK